MGPVFTENFNDFAMFMFVLSLITCIGDYGSKYRCGTYNISTSSCVRTADAGVEAYVSSWLQTRPGYQSYLLAGKNVF
jgi:hypothetical protein